MSGHLGRIGTFVIASALPAGLAYAQPAPPPVLPPPAAAPAPVQADAPPPVPVLPPPVWDARDALQLLGFIRGIGAEGLEPLDYDAPGLERAIASGSPAAISAASSDRFQRVASDLALGHVRGDDREGWLIKDPDLDDGRVDRLLRSAVIQHNVVGTLQALLPTHPQYGALKTALSITPRTETAKYQRIRLNLDRWRWLPRDLGERYIIVNVPAYTAALVENGETVSRHHAVAGKISTPTPQLSAVATGVILNPWWEVPKSIEKEVRGKKGYVPVKNDDGKVIRYRQPPGRSNALGQVKFVMPNPEAIYLHDTNARSKFNSRVRAFSHGCIRTEHIMDLATKLLTEGGDEWTPEKIKATLASGKSVQAKFPKPLPVYIVYMSSAAHVDGHIVDYADVYKRDGKVIEALLDGRKAGLAKAADKQVATK
jgi:murein L,D-transpeptidase YcbB/YkuD